MEVLPIFVEILKREFAGQTINDNDGYVRQQARAALVKLQICDMCRFEEYFCEFKDRYYQLSFEDQKFALNMFWEKLPGNWGTVAQKALEQRVLANPDVADTLGARAEAVRYCIRLYCMERKLAKDVSKLPTMYRLF